jgi:hypothetical protein
MPEFYGNALIVQFAGTGGTTDLSADQRVVTFSPSIQMDDKSTGSEGAKSYVTRQTDFSVTLKSLYQSGTAGVGSALEDTLAPGQAGTIYCWPQGSATGTANRKYTWPVISQGVQQNWQYTTLVELNCAFQGNGTWTFGTGG